MENKKYTYTSESKISDFELWTFINEYVKSGWEFVNAYVTTLADSNHGAKFTVLFRKEVEEQNN